MSIDQTPAPDAGASRVHPTPDSDLVGRTWRREIENVARDHRPADSGPNADEIAVIVEHSVRTAHPRAVRSA